MFDNSIARKKQSGTFVVEFAVMAFGLSLLIAFCGDVVTRLATKGKLDRIAYSTVSIIRERTVLFGDENMEAGDTTEFSDLVSIAQDSLQRVMPQAYEAANFGMILEVLTFDDAAQPQTLISFKDSDDSNCAVDTALSAVITDSATTLYRVTICYETDNWFGDLVGEDYGIVRSNALSVGR